jgi:hypothetical protein
MIVQEVQAVCKTKAEEERTNLVYDTDAISIPLRESGSLPTFPVLKTSQGNYLLMASRICKTIRHTSPGNHEGFERDKCKSEAFKAAHIP